MGEAPGKNLILSEGAAREYAASLDREMHWEFIVPKPDNEDWEPAWEFSYDQLWKFVKYETLSLGPLDDDPEAKRAIHQRIFWGYTLSKETDAMVGIMRSERRTLLDIAADISKGRGEELPDNFQRLPLGVYAASLTLLSLYGDDMVIDSVTKFQTALDSFHVALNLKGKGKVVRIEVVSIERRGMIYGVFSAISSTKSLDGNLPFVRRWSSESRITLE